jgi:AcrR family transcriptional regulator
MAYHRTERSERVRTASRTRILKAARKLFARHGYDATTMSQVVEAAGTSVGNLYFYFENKEQLLETLMTEARAPLWEWVDTVIATVPSGPARLAIILYANALGLMERDRDLTRAVLVEGAPPGIADRIVEVHRNRVRDNLRINVPGLPEEELELAASAWVGTGRGLLERLVRGDIKCEPMTLAEYAVRWNLRALRVAEPEIDAAVATASQLIAEHFPVAGVSAPRRVAQPDSPS